jgi:hypothetical protein
MNSPSNPHGWDQHKLDVEVAQRNRENFDAHQADTRNRVDTLVKLVFAVSGGALTVSLGIFLREGAPELTGDQRILLHVAWGSLFGSVAGFATLLGNLIVQAGMVAAYWKPRLGRKDGIEAFMRGAAKTVTVSWILGPISFLAFLCGLGSLAWLAIWLV